MARAEKGCQLPCPPISAHFSPFPRAGWIFLYLYYDLRACRPSVISGRVIQPGPRTPARITGGPRHRARTATKIGILVLGLYPWGLLKSPQMSNFAPFYADASWAKRKRKSCEQNFSKNSTNFFQTGRSCSGRTTGRL